MLEYEIEERVDGVHTATVPADLAERLADHGFVRTGDDLGVEEVAVPHPHAELVVVVLAELPAIGLVA